MIWADRQDLALETPRPFAVKVCNSAKCVDAYLDSQVVLGAA